MQSPCGPRPYHTLGRQTSRMVLMDTNLKCRLGGFRCTLSSVMLSEFIRYHVASVCVGRVCVLGECVYVLGECLCVCWAPVVFGSTRPNLRVFGIGLIQPPESPVDLGIRNRVVHLLWRLLSVRRVHRVCLARQSTLPPLPTGAPVVCASLHTLVPTLVAITFSTLHL